MNQEINKTETLSHGISKVTILQNWKLSKVELHPVASLDLLILQNWNIQQNWNSPHGISGFTDSAKTGTSPYGISYKNRKYAKLKLHTVYTG